MVRAGSVVVALAAVSSSGCFTVGYLTQAAGGQLDMLHRARPLGEVLADSQTPPRTRALLARVDGIKAYGRAHGLKPTRNYERYADLERSAAVWVVQACAPLSFDVKRWSFPIVGSVPYLGFFDREKARAYADQVAKEERLDVDVRGASAYSTLGWFRDPVLSTMLGEGDEALGALVNVILHESVHATLYVSEQSAFDESLASFVADRLTGRWLDEHRGAASVQAVAWNESEARGAERLERLQQTWKVLDALYRSSRSDDEKRAEKAKVLAAVQAELKLSRPLNNASLSGYRTYATGEAAFERLRQACGGDWRRFFAALRTLAARDFGRPQQSELDPVIDVLVARGCAQ